MQQPCTSFSPVFDNLVQQLQRNELLPGFCYIIARHLSNCLCIRPPALTWLKRSSSPAHRAYLKAPARCATRRRKSRCGGGGWPTRGARWMVCRKRCAPRWRRRRRRRPRPSTSQPTTGSWPTRRKNSSRSCRCGAQRRADLLPTEQTKPIAMCCSQVMKKAAADHAGAARHMA